MAELQGPAIVVVNDANFSDDDWRDIKQIGNSGKELDTSKTGRFGLGFNSVYNVTEFPAILSGRRIGFFDPHGRTVAGASSDCPGHAYSLDDLWSKYPDILAPFHSFGLSVGDSDFKGSLFRLPLRTQAQAARSAISDQPFTTEDFDSLVDKVAEQISDILLFLKNVLDIEISRIDQAGCPHAMVSAHTVNRDEVDTARSRIRHMLAADRASLLTSLSAPDGGSTVSEFEHEIEICGLSATKSVEKYLVVHGLFSDSAGQLVACARDMFKLNEKAVPLAGAATKLDSASGEAFRGRLFCTLPLPISSPVPSCHVNGFFDLQSDRQGVFQDPGAGGGSAVRVNWNQLLIEHACSDAVARLCLRLSHVAKSSGALHYGHWPRVPAQEPAVLDRLPRFVFAHLSGRDCIAAGSESVWRLPKDVLALPDTANGTVEQALLAGAFALARPPLPAFVLKGFVAASAPLTILTPALLRARLRVSSDPKCLLEKAPQRCLTKPEWIRALLEYCLSDGKLDDLHGVPLAFICDGTLRAFGLDPTASICLAGKEERELLSRKPSWFIDPSMEALPGLNESKVAGVIRFSPQRVFLNLPKVLPAPNSEGQVELAASGAVAPSEGWLVRAFEYLSAHVSEIKPEKHFEELPLIPDQFGFLNVMGKADTPLLPTTEDPKSLLNALTTAKVPLVSGTEALLKAIRAFADAYPDLAVWRLSPGDLIDTLHAVASKATESHEPLKLKDAVAILDYLATTRGVKELSGPRRADRIPALKSLRLFPSTTGQLVRLNEGDHHISADYELPKIDIELGLLDDGPKQRWRALLQALKVPPLTRALLLTKILLPQLKEFSGQDTQTLLVWLRHHLHSIREEESKEEADALIQRLGETVLVRCTDGLSRVPSLLYHPDAEFVGDLLGDTVGVPDLQTYRDRPDLWLALFETLGMARTPRADDIVDAVDEILDSDRLFDEKVVRLTRIAGYVEDQWEHLKDQPIEGDDLHPADVATWHLSDALSHRAWLPAMRSAPREYPRELLLAPTSDFYKPSEMLVREALDIAGSVLPICRIGRLSRLRASIGLQYEPKLDHVSTQLENALSLAEAEQEPLNEHVARVLHRIYDFLGRTFTPEQGGALEHDPRLPAVRDRFASRRCLVDSEGRRWLPKHCFEEPVACFVGRRARVRAELASLDLGLCVLGRRTRPTAQDYLDFFEELSRGLGEQPLPEGDRAAVRSAYEVAASLAGEEPFFSTPMLLQAGRFAPASDAVLDEAPWLSERARAAGMPFLDPALSEQVAHAFGVRLLSSAVYERPQSERSCQDSAFVGECEQLQSRLRAPQMHGGVHRLLVASNSVVRPADLQHFFLKLAVLPVADLQTTLVWTDDDKPVEGSHGPCDVVFDPNRNAVVVSEEARDVLYERIGLILSNELRLGGHDLGEAVTQFVAILRVDPAKLDGHLTKLHVRALPPSVGPAEYGLEDDAAGFIDATHAGSDLDTDVDPEAGDESRGAMPLTGTKASVESPNGGAHQSEACADAEPQTPFSIERGADEEDGGDATAKSEVSHSGANDELWGGAGSGHPPSGPVDGDASPPKDSTTRNGGAPPSTSAAGHQTGEGREERHTQPGRARTYVSPRADEKNQELPERQEHRRRVDQAAVQHALQYERERDRRPAEMPHANEGYDIESFAGDGRLERFIEVKGLSGVWTDYGVAMSHSQFRKALKEGPTFWLYVVEFALEPNRARVYAIQDPVEIVDEYWLDGGWRELANERGGVGVDAAIKEGSIVLIDGGRRGTIRIIHKRGVLMHLDVEFEDHSRDLVVYSPRRVQVVPDAQARP